MALFVRKNLLVISGSFYADDVVTNPSAVTAVLSYTNLLGTKVETTLNLSLDTTTNIWSATWDSSAAAPGRVDWALYSTGSVVAATQGFFMIAANAANVLV